MWTACGGDGGSGGDIGKDPDDERGPEVGGHAGAVLARRSGLVIIVVVVGQAGAEVEIEIADVDCGQGGGCLFPDGSLELDGERQEAVDRCGGYGVGHV